MPWARTAGILVAATLIAMALTACSRVGGYTDRSAQSEVSCDEIAAAVVQRARADDTSGAINNEIQYLSDNCPDDYEITIDYISSRGTDPQFGFETCEEWAQYIRAEAVELLRADGLCSDGAAAADEGSGGLSGGGLPWDEAVNHAGSNQRVCGPLAGMGTDNDDVFLNLGRDYPDTGRFTIVLWDVGGVESLPAGTTVCATGPITLYNGVAQIELDDVGAVEVGY